MSLIKLLSLYLVDYDAPSQLGNELKTYHKRRYM